MSGRFNLEVFKYRSYRLFLVANMLSFIAFSGVNLALSWQMVELTDSPLLITLVQVVAFTPVLLLSAFGGVLADNFNRKYVVLTSDTLQLANLAVIAVLVGMGVAEVWHVLTSVSVSGVLFALSGASRQTMQSLILKPELFRVAASTYAFFFNMAVLVTPAITLVTLPTWGVFWTLITALLIRVAAMAVTIFIHLRQMAHEHLTLRGVGSNLASGFSFSVHNVNLRALLALLAVVVISIGSYRAILPVFADDVYNVGETGFALLGLFAGIGAVLGAFIIAVGFNRVDYGKHHGYVWGILAGAGLIGFALSPYFELALVFMVVVGASLAAFLAFNVSTITVIAPDSMRGRIMSFRGVIFGTTPIGTLALGIIAENWTARIGTITLAVVGLVGLTLLYAIEHHHFITRHLRRFRA